MATVKPMFLTSPHFRGKEVGRRQRLLNGKNVFKEDYHRGKIDDDFGPETARSCVRAKHWLGYPPNRITPEYAGELDGYLRGTVKLPPDFAKRRKVRLKALSQVTLGEKAATEAYKYLGVKEKPPNSNKVIFTTRWQMVGPWCNMFVSEMYIDSGSKVFTIGDDWAYVPYFLNAAWNADYNGLSLVRWEHVKRGDPVCFDWQTDYVPDHIGLFVEKLSSTTFKAIEGNTSGSSNSDGGAVEERVRSLSNVAKIHGSYGFARVGR